jgi:hypothetical protein
MHVWMDLQAAGVEVVYVVEDALRSADRAEATPSSYDTVLQEAMRRAGGVSGVDAAGDARLQGLAASQKAAAAERSGGSPGGSAGTRLPCVVFSVGPCAFRNACGQEALGHPSMHDKGLAESRVCVDRILQSYSGEVSSVQVHLSTVEAGTRLLGDMHGVLPRPPKILLTAHQVITRSTQAAEAGDARVEDVERSRHIVEDGTSSWRMEAGCASVKAVVLQVRSD